MTDNDSLPNLRRSPGILPASGKVAPSSCDPFAANGCYFFFKYFGDTMETRCAVPACRRIIVCGTKYYPLANGAVKTCVGCAISNGRGWDKVSGMESVFQSRLPNSVK